MYDIVALGESLIDFTPAGINEMGNASVQPEPGRCAGQRTGYGIQAAEAPPLWARWAGMPLAAFFRSTWRKPVLTAPPCDGMTGCPRPLPLSNWMSTATAPSPSIEIQGRMWMLRPEEVDDTLLEGCRIFHFGSVSLTKEPCRGTTLWVARRARERGLLSAMIPTTVLSFGLVWKLRAARSVPPWS